MIIAKNLVKKFILKEGKFLKKEKHIVEVVKDVSLKIKEGDIVGLIGINGAGKTTTIKMLTTLLEPTTGELFIDEINAIKHHMKAKNRINIISGGERNLYWRLTAKENLNYFGSLYGLPKAVLDERVDQLLKIFGLEDSSNITVERFSKGMKQRLQIARGLINDPKYIFLDEPTLGLDVIIAKELRHYIKMLAKEKGKGILLTTHYLSEIEELCDYVYIIHEGRIILEGNIEEIKNQLKKQYRYVLIFDSPISNYDYQILEDSNNTIVCTELNELTITSSSDNLSLILSFFNKIGAKIISVKNIEPSFEDSIFELLNKR